MFRVAQLSQRWLAMKQKGVASAIRFEEPKASALAEGRETTACAAPRVVAIGADHCGFDLKEEFRRSLEEWDCLVRHLGPSNHEGVDCPDFAEAVPSGSRTGRRGGES